jgi:hypothetical protein
MSIPSLGLAFVASDRIALDYRPLASSWVLLFFPFLVLSTLRLSSLVSSVAGITGAIGYLLAASYNGWHIKADLQSNSVAHSAVPVFAIIGLIRAGLEIEGCVLFLATWNFASFRYAATNFDRGVRVLLVPWKVRKNGALVASAKNFGSRKEVLLMCSRLKLFLGSHPSKM